MKLMSQLITSFDVLDHDDMIRGVIGVTFMGERAYNEGDFTVDISVGWGLPSWRYLTGKYWKRTIINWIGDIEQTIGEDGYRFVYTFAGFRLTLGWWWWWY